LPNQRNAQVGICLGKRNGGAQSSPARANDGNVCFDDFHVSLSITEVMSTQNYHVTAAIQGAANAAPRGPGISP